MLKVLLPQIPSYLWAAWVPRCVQPRAPRRSAHRPSSVVFETFLFGLTVLSAFTQLQDGSDFGALYTILLRDGEPGRILIPDAQ